MKQAWKWVKWHLIVLKSEITGKTAVDFMGSSYLVAGNIVKKVR